MKNLLTLLFTILSLCIKSQTHKLNYKVILSPDNYTVDLISDESYSISIVHYDIGNFTAYPDNFYLKISKSDSIPLHNGDFIYFTDNKNKIIYSDNFILKKGGRYWVEETIPQISWINETTDSTVVKGEFMGRKYQVRYDESIKNIGGPLKFQNLPGLITEIKSYEPEYISLSLEKIDIIVVDWDNIIQQLKTIKPETTPISVYRKMLEEDLTKKINFLKSLKTTEDLMNNRRNIPIKLTTLENSYYESYNNSWDLEMERIMGMANN
ncbi:MAG: hypothetical protein ACK5IC_06075 [Moheibacter sp.]